ncbi:heparinase [Lutibacter sp. HS1-25]|uniref:heparinase II/III family protein n=1 Tax=Lutibacter sp. HS1-25 TaxID=2485000 RepID=UPI0010105063|nr:heparinase II/III family protein [Lutibacter sp. HS1-25]RXP57920.1 heparinase [Lutibacter sp. HS1-25]
MKTILFSILIFISSIAFGQEIPTNKVISTANLYQYLNASVQQELSKNGVVSEVDLANYFREKFAERYFYNWKNFNNRFEIYQQLYPENKVSHTENALDHISKFADSTQWVLPFNYLNGEPVNAYALRHLARQHKMVDIAFYYNYQNKDTKYLNYFVNQVASLNSALELNQYEKIEDGNGVYEAFRSGYRVLNWLEIHNMFLGEKAYTHQDQLTTIATLLQHAANLYATNTEFVAGNHQTRGMSALAMLSILFRDFKGADNWYKRSMQLLGEHLDKEINDDGFQFERSVHYHMSDIENYYFVYQLAKLSGIKVAPFWEEKLNSLFTTLTKIAYPDKSAPVLQDDTDNPWAEKNDISGALTLGYLLFEEPSLGYFANSKVASKMYWYLSKNQLSLLDNIQKEQPNFQSISFLTTGYFVQRNGWDLNDNMMIISAGLDPDKPDHQHGDMLGVQAMANGKVVLPNYQVRYSLEDYGFFKNSMVKNVALVDDELQGKKYTSNQGGSGFGKFLALPNPKVIIWENNSKYDLFVGSHNGFENVDVAYSRQVINVKNDFWIVKDNFKSAQAHVYKQVWQGHYSVENGVNLIRATFDDATGFDIFQLHKIDNVKSEGTRGKQWSVLSKTTAGDFSFVTILFPYKGFDNRIDELKTLPDLKGWKLNAAMWVSENENTISLTKENESYFFGVKKLKYNNKTIEFSEFTDAYINTSAEKIEVKLLGNQNVGVDVKD